MVYLTDLPSMSSYPQLLLKELMKDDDITGNHVTNELILLYGFCVAIAEHMHICYWVFVV